MLIAKMKAEIDFEKMSDEEVDAAMDRQMAELDKQFDEINKVWGI